jgi:hypothetical protein
MEDNARKFITGHIGTDFLKQSHASSYDLVIDWIVTEEESEEKVVRKQSEDGAVQLILVEKVISDGKRITEKKKLTEEECKSLLGNTTVHLEKRRYEFSFIQDDISFDLKYDEFSGGKLCLLEVDAPNEDLRNGFLPDHFPYKLKEVTGDMNYYGYRIVPIISNV